MDIFDYKVIPAPRKGKKVKGLRSSEERFAHAVAEAMNELAADGWEYLRADVLPCDERKGLTSTVTTYHTLLVFRRPRATARAADPEPAPAPATAPRLVAAPAAPASVALPPLTATPGAQEAGAPLPFPAPERGRD